MIRNLLAVLSCLLLGAGPGWLAQMPEAEPSPYVSPLEILKGTPAGAVSIVGELTCSDPVATARAITGLRIAEGLSDDRALASWVKGWISGQRSALPSLKSEHSKRVSAEAQLASIPEKSTTDRILTFPLTPLILASIGFAAGYAAFK